MIDSVLAIDPGREKCGLAVVSRDAGVLARVIVRTEDLPDTARLLALRFKPEAVIVGSGTGHSTAEGIASGLGVPCCLVDERFSTQRARMRYFKDHPPRGWRRLLPKGLLVPDQPYDDYAAIVLAEEFLERGVEGVERVEGVEGVERVEGVEGVERVEGVEGVERVEGVEGDLSS